MSGAPLLHNMSVPPRSTVTVRRFVLGQRYLIDARLLKPEEVKALQDYGSVGALAILDGILRAGRDVPAYDSDANEILARRLTRELEAAEVPNRLGVFIEWDGEWELTTSVDKPLGLALLARRSGPLYLPRRRFEPSLIVAKRIVLTFPEL